MTARHLIAAWSTIGLVLAACGGDPISTPDRPEVDDPIITTDATSDDTTPDDTTTTDATSDDTTRDDTNPDTSAPDAQRSPIVTAEAGGPVITVYTTADGLASDRIAAVDVGTDGTVWVATEALGSTARSAQTFAHLDGVTFVDVGAPDRAALDGDDQSGDDAAVFGMDVSGGPDGTLWLANTWFDSVGDVYLYDGSRWSSPVTSTAGLGRGVAAPDGTLWSVSMVDATVDEHDDVLGITFARVDDEGSEIVAPPPGGVPCGFCVEFDVDSTGSLWTSTEHGTFRRDGDDWVALAPDAPTDDDASGVDGPRWALGRDDGHWFLRPGRAGTDEYELTRVHDDEVLERTISADPTDVDLACVATAYGVDIDEVEDRMAEGMASTMGFVSFVGDAAGRAWFGVPCIGVYRIEVDTGDVLHLGLADGLPSVTINDLDAHPDGSVWVATDAGLARILVTD